MALGWLLAALPDCPAVVRLRAEALLDAGDHEDAEALLNQALLRSPRHPGLRALRVRSLLARGAARAAEREARTLVAARSHHLGALTLAGAAALAAGHPRRAIARLRRAVGLRPHEPAARRLLVEALLAADRPEAAEVVLHGLRDPDPLLRSRVLSRQQRMREAIDLLEAHLTRPRTDAPALEIELLDLLERSGDLPSLEARIRHVAADAAATPVLRLAAADAALAIAAFGSALRLAAPLRQSPRHAAEAWSIVTVALASLGRISGAQRAFLRLQRTGTGSHPVAMARLWRRAAAGACIARQLDPGTAAGDRNPSPIEPLLREALATFDRHAGRGAIRPGGSHEAHRAACLTALGDHRAAFTAAARAIDRLAA